MDLHLISEHARDAFYSLSAADIQKRNDAIKAISVFLEQNKDLIFDANNSDMNAASELSAPLRHRLLFDESKLSQVQNGLSDLACLPDPIGITTLSEEITPGLDLYRITCPIGVIGVIFESRPDALVQITSLAIKSGNSVILKGGHEALHTNRVLCDCIRKALVSVGLPADCSQLLESRDDVAAMLKEDTLIDLIIPRGSNSFVRYIMDNSRIPVLGHSDGICHVYIDSDADPDIAEKVVIDSKTQNVSVCNAMETLLIHSSVAPDILPPIAVELMKHSVRIYGDTNVQKIIRCETATSDSWKNEYLDYAMNIRIVASVQEAVEHINRYGSHHTDCIVTQNDNNAEYFLKRVDSAGVYRNVSTRFADGFVYGFGAEVGIATGKIHARGPMGLEGLTTYKYHLIGSGQTLAEMKDGRRKYTHVFRQISR